MRTETITIYSYSELSEEAKATAYKAWEPDYAFEADTGNYVITVDPKKYRIFDRAAGKPLVNGVVRIDEQDMKDILAAAPKSQRGWI